MNLFFLHIDPKQCAIYHCDKHVVKMILELTQMLYTAHNMVKTENLPEDSYLSFSPKHPTCIWVRLCVENYRYTVNVAKHLCEEYTYRYGKIHTCQSHIEWLHSNVPVFVETSYGPDVILSYNKKFQEQGHTPVPLAMYPDVKYADTFKSYRMYYIVYKRTFATWKNRPTPWWYTSGNYKKIKCKYCSNKLSNYISY